MNEEQIKALQEPLNSAHVSKRKGAGNFTLSYIEGWWAISEANRIFGFDGWTRETIGLTKVQEIEVSSKWRVAYICKCKVIIGDGVVREGTGYGQGIDKDLGGAHESAVKEAETDAMKRALMTFGNPFGLALYDKTQANVVDAVSEHTHPPAEGLWKTASDLKVAAMNLHTEITSCEDENQLNGLLVTNAALVKAIKERAPSWWNGKPGTDFTGYSAQIEEKRKEFRDKQLGGMLVP